MVFSFFCLSSIHCEWEWKRTGSSVLPPGRYSLHAWCPLVHSISIGLFCVSCRMKKARIKFKHAGPFLLVCAIMLYCWGQFLFGIYVATWRHWVALGLVTATAVIYFLQYRLAVWVTGLILLLATFNLLSFFAVISAWWMTIFGWSTPKI